MKKLSKLAVALGSALLCWNVAYSSGQPTTFIGPTLKGGYTRNINNNTAYSLLGEVGVKNFRAGGTLGWKLEQNQYAKVSAEYLWQNISYHFFSGSTTQWVQQGALGAGYLYEFMGYSYDPHFDLNAYVSHAPSKSLNNRNVLVNTSTGTATIVDHRRIAGSNGAGITLAVSIAPWNGARAGLGLNYDNVRYDKNYARNEDAKGLGGTFTFRQVVNPDVNFGLSAAVRQPFNNYAADVKFANVPYFGRWVIGVDGDYTSGKNTLPNTWDIGLTANYAFDDRLEPAPVYKDAVHYKDKMYKDQMQPVRDDLMSYTADPAVYMPQVLAVPDSETTGCSAIAPSLTGIPIPPLVVIGPGSETEDAAPSFAPSSGLTYSITSDDPLVGGNLLSINPTTGVITATAQSTQTIIATVTATNSCGESVSTTTTISYSVVP